MALAGHVPTKLREKAGFQAKCAQSKAQGLTVTLNLLAL
jgi:hypothetical protein